MFSQLQNDIAILEGAYIGPKGVIRALEAKIAVEAADYPSATESDIHRMALICAVLGKDSIQDFKSTAAAPSSSLAPRYPLIMGVKRGRCSLEEMVHFEPTATPGGKKQDTGKSNENEDLESSDCLYQCALPINWDSPQKALQIIRVTFARKSHWPNDRKEVLTGDISFVEGIIDKYQELILEAVYSPADCTADAHEMYLLITKKLLGIVIKLSLVHRHWTDINQKIHAYFLRQDYFPDKVSCYEPSIVYNVFTKVTSEMGYYSARPPRSRGNNDKRTATKQINNNRKMGNRKMLDEDWGNRRR